MAPGPRDAPPAGASFLKYVARLFAVRTRAGRSRRPGQGRRPAAGCRGRRPAGAASSAALMPDGLQRSRSSTGSGGGPKRSVSSARTSPSSPDRARPRDAPVGVDLGRLVGDVVRRHVGGDGQVDAHRRRQRRLLAGQLVHRLFQHLRVHLEADGGHVPALLVAEQVAGAADLEVGHGDLEAGAEVGVVAERRQTGRRVAGEQVFARVEQVGVGVRVAAPDASADLVQLRQAEHVGAIDDQRVGRRDVDAALDDRRRHQHVGLAGEEREHDLLQLALAPSARGRRARAPPARARARARPPGRWSPRGCAGRRPGPRGRAPSRWPRARGRRGTRRCRCGSRGGRAARVSMTEISRMPVRLICRVRGIGVAERLMTSTWSLRLRSSSFWRTPKRCSSSTMTRPRSFGRTSVLSSRCVPTSTSTLPRLKSRGSALLGGSAKARDHADLDRQLGEALLEGHQCCSARMVVGTSTSVCLPASAALNAARRATSVLP